MSGEGKNDCPFQMKPVHSQWKEGQCLLYCSRCSVCAAKVSAKVDRSPMCPANSSTKGTAQGSRHWERVSLSVPKRKPPNLGHWEALSSEQPSRLWDFTWLHPPHPLFPSISVLGKQGLRVTGKENSYRKEQLGLPHWTRGADSSRGLWVDKKGRQDW